MTTTPATTVPAREAIQAALEASGVSAYLHARDLATGDPADAVRDREERRARVLTDDVAILVDLANATGVAAARGPRR